MAWADKVRLCIDWQERDRERLAEIRAWLDLEREETIGDIAERLIRFNGVQPLMGNARFVRRLHDVLHEWLTGLLEGRFDGDGAESRRALAAKLAEVDLTFGHVILLEGMARERLSDLVRNRLGDEPAKLSSAMRTLSKAMTYDRALVYAGCLDLHDERMEQALLDRFLSVTGFSPTLYESLVEARDWHQQGGGLERREGGLDRPA